MTQASKDKYTKVLARIKTGEPVMTAIKAEHMSIQTYYDCKKLSSKVVTRQYKKRKLAITDIPETKRETLGFMFYGTAQALAEFTKALS